MKILIVGGAGYIGSHMVQYLGQRDIDVITLDNLSTGHASSVTYGKLITVDIRSRSQLASVFTKYSFDAVIHFAGLSIVGDSFVMPHEYYENNFLGTFNLLNAAISARVNNFVFSSTAAIYGSSVSGIIRENCSKNPISPYGKTKAAVELLLADYKSYGLNYVSLRYFNAAGADPGGVIGERHDPETHLIPIALQVANGEREMLSIYGSDYDTKDGTAVRDYVHVVDLCQAHLLAIEYLLGGGRSACFNLGNGRGFSVREVVNTVELVTGKKLALNEAARREGDPAILVACSDHIRTVLGWQPEFPDLDTMVRHAWMFVSQSTCSR